MGRTENIEVLNSTNECYELSALIISRVWVYDRHSVTATRRKDRRLSATLEYQITDESTEKIRALLEAEGGLDRDAQPMLRIPPRVSDFQRCIRNNFYRVERVKMEFDVSVDGIPENIKVQESTSSCYEKAAINSVKQWIYAPKIVDRQPVPCTGVLTTIEFQLGEQ